MKKSNGIQRKDLIISILSIGLFSIVSCNSTTQNERPSYNGSENSTLTNTSTESKTKEEILMEKIQKNLHNLNTEFTIKYDLDNINYTYIQTYNYFLYENHEKLGQIKLANNLVYNFTIDAGILDVKYKNSGDMLDILYLFDLQSYDEYKYNEENDCFVYENKILSESILKTVKSENKIGSNFRITVNRSDEVAICIHDNKNNGDSFSFVLSNVENSKIYELEEYLEEGRIPELPNLEVKEKYDSLIETKNFTINKTNVISYYEMVDNNISNEIIDKRQVIESSDYFTQDVFTLNDAEYIYKQNENFVEEYVKDNGNYILTDCSVGQINEFYYLPGQMMLLKEIEYYESTDANNVYTVDTNESINIVFRTLKMENFLNHEYNEFNISFSYDSVGEMLNISVLLGKLPNLSEDYYVRTSVRVQIINFGTTVFDF